MGCYSCEYLYELLREGFIEAGGDESWLEKKSETLPQKLKRIVELNYDLAYKPWTLAQGESNLMV